MTFEAVPGQTDTAPRNPRGGVEKSDICAASGRFAYAGSHPHALSSIAGVYDGVTNPNFFYDADGNLACMTALAQCDGSAAKTASWTSFDMVGQVVEGATTVGLLYDTEHGRVQQTTPDGVTNYFNDVATGAMNERFAPVGGGTPTWRNYLTVDGHIVAERTSKGATVTVRYFVLDHLGSTVALTDESGHLVESDAYDAWGKQRNPTTGADDTTCSLPQTDFSTRGFTGQEQMPDGLCLVNMNARIYDPGIGRFMSPDDMVPDIYNGQSYNRYTYVGNNPLSYTDPTGHLPNTNSSALADLSAGHLNVYVDESGEAHVLGISDGTTANLINHALNDSASHGGLSGSHLAIAFSNGTVVAAFTFTGGGGHAGPNDLRTALATYFDQHNSSGGQEFSAGFTFQAGPDGKAGKSQALSYETIFKQTIEEKASIWAVQFHLSQPASDNGIILQHVVDTLTVTLPDGHVVTQTTEYWESMDVQKGSTITSRAASGPRDDDTIEVEAMPVSISGSFTASLDARFFPGQKTPYYFSVDNPVTHAGSMPSSILDPDLPTTNATPPVSRTLTFNWGVRP